MGGDQQPDVIDLTDAAAWLSARFMARLVRNRLWLKSVSTGPGATQLTRIPRRASFLASERVEVSDPRLGDACRA